MNEQERDIDRLVMLCFKKPGVWVGGWVLWVVEVRVSNVSEGCKGVSE